MKNKKRILDLVVLSILASLAVVLRLLSIPLITGGRLIFYNIPIMISSFLFGVIPGTLVAIIADLSSMMYQPGWTPIFMIPPIFWGIIPGILKKILDYQKIKNLFIIETIAHLIVSILNTIALIIMVDFNYAFGIVSVIKEVNIFGFVILFNEGIPVRIITVLITILIKIPIDVLILNTVIKRVLKPLKIIDI